MNNLTCYIRLFLTINISFTKLLKEKEGSLRWLREFCFTSYGAVCETHGQRREEKILKMSN